MVASPHDGALATFGEVAVFDTLAPGSSTTPVGECAFGSLGRAYVEVCGDAYYTVRVTLPYGEVSLVPVHLTNRSVFYLGN